MVYIGLCTCQAEPAAETTVAESEATADAGLKVLGDSLLEHGQNETIGFGKFLLNHFQKCKAAKIYGRQRCQHMLEDSFTKSVRVVQSNSPRHNDANIQGILHMSTPPTTR